MPALLILLLCSFGGQVPMAPSTGSIRIKAQCPEPNAGTLYIAVFRQERFLEDGQEISGRSARLPLADNGLNVEGIPAGAYSVALFQDINGNGKMDKNYLGIPTEPYGFSNNPKVKWQSPTFVETVVEVEAGAEKEIEVRLKYWKDF